MMPIPPRLLSLCLLGVVGCSGPLEMEFALDFVYSALEPTPRSSARVVPILATGTVSSGEPETYALLVDGVTVDEGDVDRDWVFGDTLWVDQGLDWETTEIRAGQHTVTLAFSDGDGAPLEASASFELFDALVLTGIEVTNSGGDGISFDGLELAVDLVDADTGDLLGGVDLGSGFEDDTYVTGEYVFSAYPYESRRVLDAGALHTRQVRLTVLELDDGLLGDGNDTFGRSAVMSGDALAAGVMLSFEDVERLELGRGRTD